MGKPISRVMDDVEQQLKALYDAHVNLGLTKPPIP